VVDVGRAQAMAVSAALAWSGAVLGGEAGSGAGAGEARVRLGKRKAAGGPGVSA